MNKCPFCNNPSGFNVKGKERKYCSILCKNRHQNSKKIKYIECKTCKKPIKKWANGKRERIFCSRRCATLKQMNSTKNKEKKYTGKCINCRVCNKLFYVPKYRLDNGSVKYCSRSCLAKFHLEKFSDKRFKKTGLPHHKYKTIKIDGKQVRLHRYIMEQHLGRKLNKDEHVHHINDNSFDNRIENLMVLSNSDHQRIEILHRKKFTSS